MQDRFRDQDSKEYVKLKSEVKSMAKACRNFQLKLRKAQMKSGKLRAQNVALERAVARRMRDSHGGGLMTQAGGLDRGDLWKSAAIWCAVLVAGYQFLKYKVGQS